MITWIRIKSNRWYSPKSYNIIKILMFYKLEIRRINKLPRLNVLRDMGRIYTYISRVLSGITVRTSVVRNVNLHGSGCINRTIQKDLLNFYVLTKI